MTAQESFAPPPIPRQIDEALDPGWWSAALSHSSGDEIEVIAVRETWRQVNMATKLRVKLEYGTAPSDLGTTFCIKAVLGEDRIAAMSAQATGNEARFYSEIAPTIGVRVPDAVYASVDPGTGHGVVVMDDVSARGGSFLQAAQPYTVDQAAQSLDQLALLHARTWNRSGTAQAPWLENRLARLVAQPIVPTTELERLLAGDRGRTLPDALLDGDRLHAALRLLSQRDDPASACLVHGDAHAGNIFVLHGAVGLIDWQLLQVNTWALDVAYHVVATLDVPERREHEKPLLRAYLSSLDGYGADAPRWNDAWRAFRECLVYGYYLWAATRFVDPAVVNTFAHRLGTAVDDHDTYALLGA